MLPSGICLSTTIIMESSVLRQCALGLPRYLYAQPTLSGYGDRLLACVPLLRHAVLQLQSQMAHSSRPAQNLPNVAPVPEIFTPDVLSVPVGLHSMQTI